MPHTQDVKHKHLARVRQKQVPYPSTRGKRRSHLCPASHHKKGTQVPSADRQKGHSSPTTTLHKGHSSPIRRPRQERAHKSQPPQNTRALKSRNNSTATQKKFGNFPCQSGVAADGSAGYGCPLVSLSSFSSLLVSPGTNHSQGSAASSGLTLWGGIKLP